MKQTLPNFGMWSPSSVLGKYCAGGEAAARLLGARVQLVPHALESYHRPVRPARHDLAGFALPLRFV